MQRVRTLGLALVAVLMLSVAVVSSASASSFLAHPAGGILGNQTNVQKFTTGAGSVECTKASFIGTAVLKSLHQLVEVKYTGCTAFGLAATVSPAQYLFSADLKVSVENDIIISVTAAGCTILVGPAGNQNLDSVHYGTEGADLKVNALVKKILSTGSGGICLGHDVNGVYNGLATVMSATPGGVVRWDKE